MEEVDLWDLVVELEAADIGSVERERERERVREYKKGVKRRVTCRPRKCCLGQ